MMGWKKKSEWKNKFAWEKMEKNKFQMEIGSENNRDWKFGRTIKRKIVSMICMVIGSVMLHAGISYAHQQLLQQGIAEEVLRFHVIANSDSEEDQVVKLLVRDAVLEWVSEELERREEKSENSDWKYVDESEYTEQKNNESERRITFLNKKAVEKNDMVNTGLAKKTENSRKTEMERFLYAHLSEIEKVADDVLLQNGFTYKSTARIENCYFPARTYGDCTFPAGWYKALRICLGEANGHNWWCVLYPKLCFTDCLHAVVEEEQMEELEEVLTVEEYESLLQQPKKWKIAFKWF